MTGLALGASAAVVASSFGQTRSPPVSLVAIWTAVLACSSLNLMHLPPIPWWCYLVILAPRFSWLGHFSVIEETRKLGRRANRNCYPLPMD